MKETRPKTQGAGAGETKGRDKRTSARGRKKQGKKQKLAGWNGREGKRRKETATSSLEEGSRCEATFFIGYEKRGGRKGVTHRGSFPEAQGEDATKSVCSLPAFLLTKKGQIS